MGVATEPNLLLDELAKHGSCMVKILSHGNSQHTGRARLLAIDGQWAIVQPLGHRREERVPIDDVKYWKGGNHYKGAFVTDPWIVYLPQKKLFWGGSQYFRSLERAKLYESEQRAKQASTWSIKKQKNRDTIGNDTVTIARRSQIPAWVAPKPRESVVIEPAAQQAAPQVSTTTTETGMAPAPSAPVQQTIGVIPTPAPEKSPFEKRAAATRELAAARALVMQAEANQMVAETELAIIKRAKELGV